MATVTKTYTISSVPLESSFTWVANGMNENNSLYVYISTNPQRAYGYRSVDISDIPKYATITNARLRYSIYPEDDYDKYSYNVTLRDYGKQASDANIKSVLQSMTDFTSLRFTFTHLICGGEQQTIMSGLSNPSSLTTSRTITFANIVLTITYDYIPGDIVFFGVNDTWVRCKVHYGVNNAWVEVKVNPTDNTTLYTEFIDSDGQPFLDANGNEFMVEES